MSSKPWSNGSAGPIVIDLYEFNENKKRLVTSTVINQAVAVHTVHAIPIENDHPEFQEWFLSMTVNGGQFEHLLVWKFDPSSCRPYLTLDFFCKEMTLN